MLFSQTFYGLLFCYLTITDVHVTVFTNYRFPVSFLLYIATPPKNLTKSLLWTVLRILLDPIIKKITLARFACLCFWMPRKRVVSGRFETQAALIPLKTCSKDVKPHPWVLRRNGNFAYIEFVCLTRREIPLLHVFAPFMIPVWNGTW